MKVSKILQVVTTHTGGEPTCVIYGGLGPIPGKTMLERMLYMQEHEDRLRTAVCHEPRGGVRCGVILTEPCDPSADIGILHFSTSAWLPMCGHNTIGLGTALLETGLIPAVEPITNITMDTPAGIIRVAVRVVNGKPVGTAFENAPAFALALDREVKTQKFGTIRCDISYGGNIGAIVDADALGLKLEPEHARDLITEGLAIYKDISEQIEIKHPTMPHLKLHHVQFSAKSPTPGVNERSVVINKVGVIDRSPCGTGTCAKLAVRYAKGQLGIGEKFVHESLVGSTFNCKILRVTEVAGLQAVIPEIEGNAFLTGMGALILDEDDPQTYGFRLG